MNRFKSLTRILVILLVAFIATAGITAYLSYSIVHDLVATWKITGLRDLSPFTSADRSVPDPSPDVLPRATINPFNPLQSSGPIADPWDGASRVTLLVMGLDFRDWEAEQGPPRTDTMILLTVDPLTLTVGMLSIPRDMWVAIPGFEHGKINTAYQLGEAYQLPGGGPGLALETVEQLIGVPINFYAQIDFNAFVHFIDEIGGVKINVPEGIEVAPIGSKNHIILNPGIQTLSGPVALAYARARNTPGGDFDRAQRQQQVILAIRERVLRFDLIPVLIARAPVLYRQISSGVNTNMTLEQIVKLGLLAQQIPEGNITRGAIDSEHITFGVSPEGLDILKPIPDKIRVLRDQIFFSGPFSPIANDKTLEELIREETAKISVLNGTFTAGLAAGTTEYLEYFGLDITITDNATEIYDTTTIIDFTGNPYTLQYLVDLMQIDPNFIFHSYDPDSEIDIEINLGDDWVSNGQLP